MDWDDAYANAAHIPGGADYPDRWAALAAEHRAIEQAVGRAMLNLSYGTQAREVCDLFLPAGPAAGLVVFVHGGYWLRFDKSFWSHLAAGPTARGWAVAIPSYTLAPEARIGAIVRQAARAVEAAAARVAGPLVLAGHSAGGHLVARVVSADVGLGVRDRVRRVVPISPVSDLAPLMRTAMNADLRIDEAEARSESPVHQPAPEGIEVHVWVGAGERPAFLDQARWLAGAWRAQLTLEPGKHHFDVVEGLAEPYSPLSCALLDGLS
jgi:acetyl esterase/lipase